MSCPMFMYGLTAGSVIPLSIVYMMRPESLTNLFDFLASSLLIAVNWSDGVAQRFNLSHDLSSWSNDARARLPVKTYSCYNLEYWYNVFSWLIYACFGVSLIIFVANQRSKNAEPLFSNDDEQLGDERESMGMDFVFYYFCVFTLAMLSIGVRMLMEYYLLGHLKPLTVVYLLWYIVSFAIVWLWNR